MAASDSRALGLTLSQGEILLHSFHGKCKHRRQGTLPCATPGCKEGTEAPEMRCDDYVARRITVPFGDEKHFVWRTERECPSEPNGGTTKIE
jgi:hypothetical protein